MQEAGDSSEQKKDVPWLFSKAGILIMLFLVLGPFGLPLLYKSPSFKPRGKIILTLAVMIYTMVILLALVIAIFLILRMAGQYFKVMG